MSTPEKNARIIAELDALIAEFKQFVPLWVLEQGYEELKLIQDAFERSRYFNMTGNEVQVGPSSKAWRVKKQKRWGTGARPGWASGVLGRTLALRSVVRPEKNGYRFDPARANRRIRHYYTIFRAMKAPTLMNMKKGYQQRHLDRVRNGMNKELSKMRSLSRTLGKDKWTEVNLILDDMLKLPRQRSTGPISRRGPRGT